MKRLTLFIAVTASALLTVGGTIAMGSAQASATLPALSIAITPSSATVSGARESGAVNVVSSDTGVKEAAVIVFLLKPGVSLAEVEKFSAEKKAKDPNSASKYGSIVFDTEVNPGQNSEAQTDLQPGQYIVLVGAGEGEAQIRTSFTVTAARSAATLPTPQATIRSIEFGFRGPSTLHDGELVRFENEGFVVHMDVAFPVKNMTLAKRVVKLLLAGKEKGLEKLVSGPPVTFAGPLSHEAFQQETIAAKPGVYVQACFMDTQDGRSHTQLGMERIIHIVK
ncbi:MAG TPA: hypothetical protein VK730_11520 [Solirubrobacteraceae bacterium]|jgi:hypothetical protein|nr:hypothetical protein [Solirubrobacteraceae bacterium]